MIRAKLFDTLSDGGGPESEYLCGKNGGILRAPDGDRRHRNALGICTMDNSESNPLRFSVGMGTPITGNGVFAASIPGRWAAPPAPAMMT